YNALVCTDFGPEFGRENVRQIARHEGEERADDLPVTLGGRGFAGGETFEALNDRIAEGWTIARTGLTEEYGLDAYLDARPDAVLIGALRADGRLVFFAPDDDVTGEAGDAMLSLLPPRGDEARA
ncbi:MAG: sodium:proton antiporter, partial [Pseudomonadota bacterium]